MKRNRRFTTVVILGLTVLGMTIIGIIGLKQHKKLKAQNKLITELEKELSAQKELLSLDTLLVEGRYEEALNQYENHEALPIEDGQVAVGLRMAIAKKFLAFEDHLAYVAAEKSKIADTLDVVEESVPTVKVDQLDSLNFALSKTKVQLTNLRRQLRQKSFGEYLTFTNEKGSQVHYVGKVKEGKANGYGIAILNTGSRYVGEWLNNQRHGQGTFYWKDGEYYEGNYTQDKRNGQGTYYWPNGEKYVGQWKDDQRSGKGAFYAKDGKLITSGVWENDEMITENTKQRKNRSKQKDVAAL